MIGQGVLFEVRLLRGAAIQQAGSLLAVSAFAVLGVVAWQTFIVVLPSRRPFSGGRGGRCNKRKLSRWRS